MIKVGKLVRAEILRIALLVLVGALFIVARPAVAAADTTSMNDVVISAIQSGDLLSLSNEYVQITNNSAADITISGWCINYASGNSTGNGNHLACFNPSEEFHQLILPAYGTATAVSNTYKINYPNSIADVHFNAGISAASGHIILLDSAGTIVDRVGWGNAALPEGVVALPPLTATQVAQRLPALQDDKQYQDTNNNSIDFITKEALPVVLTYGMIYEQYDICINLTGVQAHVPEGYTEGTNGVCVENDTGSWQGADPYQNGSSEDSEDNHGGGHTSLSVSQVQITEIFPNPSGVDEGNEFIELYNPTGAKVYLTGHRLVIGIKGDTVISLDGLSIDAHSYLVIKNDVYPFTLTNTRGKVVLTYDVLRIASQTDEYTKAPDGKSWAYIDSAWQYVTPPTPGRQNSPNPTFIASVEPKDKGATLTPCPTGQYRHPETNRCRKITNDQGSTLVPCKENQERNPETNRCRNVSAASQKQLTPCKEGQERNPETNRCRNITSSTPPNSDYAVLGASDTGSHTSYVLWVVLAMLGLGVAYIIWEWHVEIATFFKRQWERVKGGRGR